MKKQIKKYLIVVILLSEITNLKFEEAAPKLIERLVK